MTVIECYKKVSKDCFKFIKSQETKKEKFRNKEKIANFDEVVQIPQSLRSGFNTE